MRTISLALTVAALVVAAAASAQTLTGAGATFPYPLYSKWFDVYRQKTSVAINYQLPAAVVKVNEATLRTLRAAGHQIAEAR